MTIQIKQIYLYDSETYEYLGSTTPDLDPVATERMGHPVILMPADATTIAPPKVKEHQKAVFKNGGWVKVADYRNCYIINESMLPQFWLKLGELPEGYVVITEEQYGDIIEDSLKYKWTEEGLINNPNYEKDKKNKELENKKKEIQNQLDSIDLKSIRAIRAGDTEYLAKYEKEAEELRKQLKELD